MLLMVISGFMGLGRGKTEKLRKSEVMQKIRAKTENGEFFKAVSMAEELKRKYPTDPDIAALLIEVHQTQKNRHEVLMKSSMPVSDSEGAASRRDDVATLLERAEAYFQQGHAAEAFEVAQKVFQLDPSNAKASRLMDRMTSQTLEKGAGEHAAIQQVYRDEVTERIEHYREVARAAESAGRWGEALFAAQKLLILSPSDPEALRLCGAAEKNLEKRAA